MLKEERDMKISDRLMLGFVAGLGGNIAKLAIGTLAQRLNISEIDGPGIAAGMLTPAYKLISPEGKAVGILADSVIAGLLGVGTVYMLSITGKDKALLKGALTGQVMWQSLYGVMATMGATKVQPFSPKTVLTEFVSHTAYGTVAAAIAVKLGDDKLFTGAAPLNASPLKSVKRDAAQPQSQFNRLQKNKIRNKGDKITMTAGSCCADLT
jgi:hypothetical protein